MSTCWMVPYRLPGKGTMCETHQHAMGATQGVTQCPLGKAEQARATLEAVLARSRDDGVRHLAHLFLARVEQDAGRTDEAVRGFRAALTLQPDSQAAALGLSDALQLAGEPDAARAAVEAALAMDARRRDQQAFWEYRFADARPAARLLDALRDDVAP